MAFASVAARQAALSFGSVVGSVPWTNGAGIDSDEAALALGTYPLGSTAVLPGPSGSRGLVVLAASRTRARFDAPQTVAALVDSRTTVNG